MPTQPKQLPPIELFDMKGLSLKLDIDMRDAASATILENFDCYLNGSWRKTPTVSVYGSATPVPILNFIDWRADDQSARSIIGLGTNGKLYNLDTGAQVGDCTPYLNTVPVTKAPFLAMMPGTWIPLNFRNWKANTHYNVNDAIMRYSYQDGNLYIFAVTVAGTTGAEEKTYPAVPSTFIDGTVTWEFRGLQSDLSYQRNYLAIVIPGEHPLKWQGTAVTQIGVSEPGTPVTCDPKTINTNTNGYAPIAGAIYAWTFYNPQTLHESSPTPMFGPTTFFGVDVHRNVTIEGAFLPPIPATPTPSSGNIQLSSYQQIGIGIRQSAVIPGPEIGQGFTHVRCYRTKDGGQTLFLLTHLFDKNGNIITNSDGSIPIAELSHDEDEYIALPTPQAKEPTLVAYDGYGAPNFVPGAVTLDAFNWLDDSGGLIYLIIGAGQGIGGLPSNAFGYTGTGAPSGVLIKRSLNFNLSGGVYTLQGYIDAVGMTAGTISWALMNGVGGTATPVLVATQTPGTAGFVSATGACPAGSYWVGYFINATVRAGAVVLGSDPILQLGATITPFGYPTPDAALVTPGPAPESAGPPPISEWGAVFGSSLVVQDEGDKVKLWFSDPTDFESFPTLQYAVFRGQADDEITALLGVFDSLIIGKRESIQRIVGASPSSFSPSPVDPIHGLAGKRAVLSLGSSLIGLVDTGLSLLGLGLSVTTAQSIQVGYRGEGFVGDDVKPITDDIVPVSKDDTINFAYDTNLDLLIFAIQTSNGATYNNQLLLLAVGKGPKFSTYDPLTLNQQEVITVRKVELPDGTKAVLATCNNNLTYKLFDGGYPQGYIGTIITQPLPMPNQIPKQLWGTRKVFRQMVVDGQDLQNFYVSYSVDYGPFSIPSPLNTRNLIGVEGKLLQIQFTHGAAAPFVTPTITYISIDYETVGLAI